MSDFDRKKRTGLLILVICTNIKMAVNRLKKEEKKDRANFSKFHDTLWKDKKLKLLRVDI